MSSIKTADIQAAHCQFGGELAKTQIKGATVAGQTCDIYLTFAGTLSTSTPAGLRYSSGDLTRFVRMSLDLPVSAPIAAANDNAPVDLWAERDKPSLPTGLLPVTIEEFARASGTLMGVDPGGLAVAALTVCAAAIPDSVRLQVKRHDANWQEPARLWSCVVGGPSTKKTPLLGAALEPMRAIDNALARDFAAKATAFAKLDKKAQANAERPKNVRAILEDTTMEAAQEVLRDTEAGLLLHRDELSGFFGSMEKYGNGKGSAADRAFWLQTFNGGPYSVNRVGRGPVFIPNLSVSLLGGIQPEPIRAIADGMADDGLLQRLLPIVLGSAGVDRDEPTTGEAAEYGALVRRLHGLKPAASEGDIPFNVNLRFSEDAQLVREEFAAKHHEMVAAWEEINRKLSSHLGKYDSFFNRLCVTFHCIESYGDRPDATIAADTARRAGEFLHTFLWPHALAFYSTVLGLSDDHDAVAASAGWILAKRPAEVTARDIQRGDRVMQKLTSDGAEEVLARLDAFGWLDPIETRGNQTAKRYRVRPSVFDLFEDRAEREAERRAKIRATIAQNATLH